MHALTDTTQADTIGGDTPACLWHENPPRLVSLWDLVNQLAAPGLFYLFNRLTSIECVLANLKLAGSGGARVPEAHLSTVLSVVKAYELLAINDDFRYLWDECGRARDQLSRSTVDISTAVTVLNSLKGAFVDGLKKRCFLIVCGDRTEYVEQGALFGAEVRKAFPSASSDIREAGNCLAAECNTAAVFHLMRAVEHGLRALAEDREVKLSKGVPIELGTWEDLLRQLEGAEAEIQNFPKTLAREDQYAFYHGAMMELKRFKNVFRNAVMHTREEYDRDQAHSVFVHVRAFMQGLASKIAEGVTTPRIWGV
jgi:hypothetical protein